MIYEVTINGEVMRVELVPLEAEGQWLCKLPKRTLQLDARFAGPDVVSLLANGEAFELRRETGLPTNRVWVNGEFYEAEVTDPRSFRGRKSREASAVGPRKLMAPMPGKIIRVLAKEGDTVETGQGIIVVEAMKMQNEIKSPKSGVVKKIAAPTGTSVGAGDLLAIVD